MVLEEMAFWSISVVMLYSAVQVVVSKDLFRALIWLAFGVFIPVAGLFITLNAGFVAAIQIIVMVGAIAVVILFGIMLTRRTIQEKI